MNTDIVDAIANAAEAVPLTLRVFRVEYEINRTGKAFEYAAENIEFKYPQTLSPSVTLVSVAINRVEAVLYKSPEFKDKGKNWHVFGAAEVMKK